MIDGLRPYPAYRDSGVPWLGEVPAHWEISRLGALLRERGEVNSNGQVDKVLSVLRDRGVIPYSEKGNIGNKMSEDITRYKVVRPDDIVVNCMNVIIGSVGLSRYTGCLSPVYYVLTRCSEDDDPRYLNAYFQTKPFQESLVRIGNGILAHRMRIPMELLKCESFPRPPAEEQTTIVRFLDHANRRIQRYIRAKQKLITLLEEQKQAIIHQAVTGQIDVRTGQPYPAYKPSSVEWLGEVPVDWEVVRLKFVATKIVDCLHETPKYSESGEFPAIRTADISPGTLHLSSARRIEADEYTRWIERLEPKPGDILYSREGERFGIAACVPDGVRLCISQRMMVFRIRPEHNPVFVMWLLNSKQVYAQACQDIMGATAPHVNVSTIRNYFLALPARAEQDSLVGKIENSTAGFSSAISNAKREIDLLNEYRLRLIADVVTGKLDVREAATRLPDGEAEPEQFDNPEALIDAADAER